MKTTIEIKCPHCHSESVIRNGKKHNGSQNYQCKKCGRQFIADHERKYLRCLSWIIGKVRIMLVRGIGIRDIAAVLEISIYRVLKVLESSDYEIKPKREHYDTLEDDGFWTYIWREQEEEVLVNVCVS